MTKKIGEEELRRENSVVVQLVQAMLGLVSDCMKAIALEIDPPTMTLHFCLSSNDPDCIEDAEEIAGDLDGFLLGGEDIYDISKIEVKIYVGDHTRDWPGASFRQVYSAK